MQQSPIQTFDTPQHVLLLVDMTTSLVNFPALSVAFTGATGNCFAFGTFAELLDLAFDVGVTPFFSTTDLQ
jgi:hypothetical protein